MTLLVDDFETAVAFYREVIGFEVVIDASEIFYVEFAAGGVVLALYDRVSEGGERAAQGRGGTVVTYDDPSVDDTFARLVVAGAGSVREPLVSGHCWLFRVVYEHLMAYLRSKCTECCTLLPMVKIVPFTEARSNLTELLDDLEKRQEHVLITRNGRPSAVLLSAEEYEALEETLEIVQDKEIMDALQRSEKDVKAGRLTSLTDLRRERS